MSRSSVIMLPSTQGTLDLVGSKTKADGWYGFTDGLHTVSIKMVNFTGRIYFEGSISVDPTDGDWFPIEVSGSAFLEFPVETGPGFTGTLGRNITGGFTWIRARVDRSYLSGLPANATETNYCGYVDSILMNN